jgi:hypothetical protein
MAIAAALPLCAQAQSSDNDGCTNATLSGDYAFRLSGQLLPPNAAPVSRDGIAMTHFDGFGGLTQVDFVMSNGVELAGVPDPITGFHIKESGWYHVNSDCTGSAEIRFPAPPGIDSGAVINLMFVLGDHGRLIHTIVSSVLPPGSTMPVPVSIHSDGEKLQPPSFPRR